MELTGLRRGIGYVIQQIGLFPHMTWPTTSPPSRGCWAGTRPASRGASTSCSSSSGSTPSTTAAATRRELSGGQRQRVGLARAMAADPPLMLMDEPFGAIDPITRDRLQNEFLRLHREIRKTVIFVTHDIDEAIKMGDRIAILREGGVLAQYATPDEILASPADEFVASLRGRGPRPQAPVADALGRSRARAAARRRRARRRADGDGGHVAARRALADADQRRPAARRARRRRATGRNGHASTWCRPRCRTEAARRPAPQRVTASIAHSLVTAQTVIPKFGARGRLRAP